MAVNFKTTNPSLLLSTYKKAIQEKEVVTWSYDQNGDFYHTPPQWQFKAWMRPVLLGDWLIFNIVGNQTVVTTTPLYAVLHGRLIESMLSHCDRLFSNASATPLPTNADIITSSLDLQSA